MCRRASPPWLRASIERLREQLPNARLEVLAGLGHNGPDQQAPETVARALQAFLQASPAITSTAPRPEAPPA
ncbi:MAG: hypothetical protein U1E65_32295 [Myxococcota bacterium]